MAGCNARSTTADEVELAARPIDPSEQFLARNNDESINVKKFASLLSSGISDALVKDGLQSRETRADRAGCQDVLDKSIINTDCKDVGRSSQRGTGTHSASDGNSEIDNVRAGDITSKSKRSHDGASDTIAQYHGVRGLICPLRPTFPTDSRRDEWGSNTARAFQDFISPEDIEVLESVGNGRFSKTYRARWQDRVVAVKTVEFESGNIAAKAEDDCTDSGTREAVVHPKSESQIILKEFQRELVRASVTFAGQREIPICLASSRHLRCASSSLCGSHCAAVRGCDTLVSKAVMEIR